MGNQHNTDEFNPQNWTKIETKDNVTNIWQNNHNRHIHIEQYLIHSKNEEQLSLQRQLYFQRKNHPYWVAAYYFQEEKNTSMCMIGNAAHIYIQKIPINIYELRQLSMNDLLHIYNQCFQGFKTLAQILGCFRVRHQYIGVNQRGVVKVWAGPQWWRIGVTSKMIKEEEMVQSIIQCLQIFNFYSLKNFLHRNTQNLTFRVALEELRNFSSQYNQGIIPSRIQSLQKVENFDMFLDPLLKSKHHFMQQSKHIPYPQSNNSSLYKYRDQGAAQTNLRGNNQEAKSLEKSSYSKNKKPLFSIFSCMNVPQSTKTSKLFTRQEMINHYADFYHMDKFQEKPFNNQSPKQNTQFNNSETTNNERSLYFSPKPSTIQGLDMLQNQNTHQSHFSAQIINNNNQRYSFQTLKQEQPFMTYHNPHIHQMRPSISTQRIDNLDSKLRGRSVAISKQTQFIKHKNPKITFEQFHYHKNPQTLPSQIPITQLLPPQKIPIHNQIQRVQSKLNFYYHTLNI